MITEEENEILTRVGPGTPCGELMRRYWHPIAVTSELDRNPTKRVRLLCEDLVLYRDRSGTLGLVEPQCAHRRVDLYYGIPEAAGIRCPYHGWLYDESGACTEQPYEQAADPGSRFRDKVRLNAYPVQELGGMIWAYLGPDPAPLLPRWEPLIREGSLRDVGSTVIPCNWLQIQENSLDPVHTEWLHGALTNYAYERQGMPDRIRGRVGHEKVGFDVFEHGIIKRRVTEGLSEDSEEWRRGHPILFPNILVVGALDAVDFQFRVPIDDEHTQHYFYTVNTPGIPVPTQRHPELFDVPVPMHHEQGAPRWEYLDTAPGQDIIAWVTQGAIAKREKERLGLSDTGVILFRKLLSDNIEKVQRGEDPMNTFRDPVANQCVRLQTEFDHSATGTGPAHKYSPLTPEIRRLFAEAQEKAGAR
ncbi:MAG: 5,5-dehydrodivanillate O-demethylase oxygenase subunit [Chloroflexota bacterium]|jgi:5,5'-dehydrodivanillate O-demethylase|nr:5,5-dehydrodivanillate O-demethylase oxygenase subunit [Chloroflexota bacterium]